MTNPFRPIVTSPLAGEDLAETSPRTRADASEGDPDRPAKGVQRRDEGGGCELEHPERAERDRRGPPDVEEEHREQRQHTGEPQHDRRNRERRVRRRLAADGLGVVERSKSS